MAALFPPTSLPAEMVSMIWEQTVLAAVEDARDFFSSVWYCDSSDANEVLGGREPHSPDHTLRHPLTSYLLVSKSVKHELERVVKYLYPTGLGLCVFYCDCQSPDWVAMPWVEKHCELAVVEEDDW
jgi:hypothetical protein